jgi:pilus assembly protein CpaE
MWTGWIRRTLLAADEIVLTVEPELANLRNAKNLIDLMRASRKHDAPPRLVINKTTLGKRPEIKVDDFAKALDLVPTAVIPFDAQLFGTAANNGQMIAETDPKSPIVASFDLIARAVTGRTDVKRPARTTMPLLSRFRTKKNS